MNCDEAKLLLMDIDHLSHDQQAALEKHAQTCATCASELSALRSMIGLTRPLQSIDVASSEDSEFSAGIKLAGKNESRQRWMFGGQPIPWLAAASLFLAGLFIYEQLPTGQLPEGDTSQGGTVLNASVYRKELNKIRDSDAYRAKLFCRSPFRKPEQTAECVRQKFIKTFSL
jgi:anti-sigma factor RsiW